jgi:hypothetical protein
MPGHIQDVLRNSFTRESDKKRIIQLGGIAWALRPGFRYAPTVELGGFKSDYFESVIRSEDMLQIRLSRLRYLRQNTQVFVKALDVLVAPEEGMRFHTHWIYNGDTMTEGPLDQFPAHEDYANDHIFRHRGAARFVGDALAIASHAMRSADLQFPYIAQKPAGE